MKRDAKSGIRGKKISNQKISNFEKSQLRDVFTILKTEL